MQMSVCAKKRSDNESGVGEGRGGCVDGADKGLVML